MESPEIPEPQKAAGSTEKPTPPDPALNGNGMTDKPEPALSVDTGQLVQWMEATDKELKILRIQGLVLSAALIALIVMTKPKLSTP